MNFIKIFEKLNATHFKKEPAVYKKIKCKIWDFYIGWKLKRFHYFQFSRATTESTQRCNVDKTSGKREMIDKKYKIDGKRQVDSNGGI